MTISLPSPKKKEKRNEKTIQWTFHFTLKIVNNTPEFVLEIRDHVKTIKFNF